MIACLQPDRQREEPAQKTLGAYFLCQYGFKSAGFSSSSFLKESNFPDFSAALRAVSFDGLEHHPNSSEIELSSAGRSAFFVSLAFAEK